MRKIDFIGIVCLSIIIGISIGMVTNNEISYYAGKMEGIKESRELAKQWATQELRRLCPSWFTDKRKDNYMACKKADWMK